LNFEFASFKSNNILNSETKPPLTKKIFNVTEESFTETAVEIFNYQWQHNAVYRQYCDQLNVIPSRISRLEQIPFLPIGFFKTHTITSFEGNAQKVFTSSGTTGTIASRHLVKSLAIYEQSFIKCFKQFYGETSNYAFLCLLPSYLGREGSSLVYMAEELVRLSANPDSGFFLQATGKMTDILLRREKEKRPTIILGVTYALLDFAAGVKFYLNHTIIMETGGMKGRREELTRAQVHEALTSAFGTNTIHSEYGMTELLSQAYSKGNGFFNCPPWMKVVIREEDDPFSIKFSGVGLLCIIDLANIYSCSFIETADVGKVYENGSFEVLGRIDNSDIRGCSLLAL
jgi:phenylacetate-coenzyme A ligase PaaK-like adenylate-forming protein